KIKIKEAIIVEGAYDRITLCRTIQTIILATNGFGIRSNAQMIGNIKKLAQTIGVIIFTDSDVAGFKIRQFLCGVLPKSAVKHAYAPQIFGKEKRKKNP
ncbi:MAG: toprim domain-containing protein, partial [Oscillospiraceae bacterium]|nr:toprim domain-containing protein [Oscillospiraceae bacterium]